MPPVAQARVTLKTTAGAEVRLFLAPLSDAVLARAVAGHPAPSRPHSCDAAGHEPVLRRRCRRLGLHARHPRRDRRPPGRDGDAARGTRGLGGAGARGSSTPYLRSSPRMRGMSGSGASRSLPPEVPAPAPPSMASAASSTAQSSSLRPITINPAARPSGPAHRNRRGAAVDEVDAGRVAQHQRVQPVEVALDGRDGRRHHRQGRADQHVEAVRDRVVLRHRLLAAAAGRRPGPRAPRRRRRGCGAARGDRRARRAGRRGRDGSHAPRRPR